MGKRRGPLILLGILSSILLFFLPLLFEMECSPLCQDRRYGGTLIYGVQQEPEIFNPMLSSMFYTSLLSNLVFSYFVKVDDQLRVVPDLIEEVPSLANGGISKDFLTYTYKLKKGVRWHDGRPLTSRDVIFTFKIVMNPRVNVVSRQGYDRVERVEAPDAHTVVFHLKEVFAPFYLIFSTYPILPEHLLGRVKGEDFQRHLYHRRPTGTGPFRLKEWAVGSHMVFEANDDYFLGRPFLDRVIFKFIPNENNLLLQMKTGEIGLYDGANPFQLKQLERMEGIEILKAPTLTWEHIDLNTEDPILRDVRVRRAIALAISRQELSERVYQGLWRPAYSHLSPLSWAYPEGMEALWSYDPELASKLLEEAGWMDEDGDGLREKGDQPLSLTLSTTSGRPNRERSEVVLQKMLKKVGIEVKVRNYNASLLFANYEEGGILQRGKFQLAMFAWVSGPDPDVSFLWAKDQIPPRGQNTSRFKHDLLSQLLLRGTRVVESEQRKRIYGKVQEILAQEVPTIPLLYWENLTPYRRGLKGLKPNPSQNGNAWNCHEWWIDEDLSP